MPPKQYISDFLPGAGLGAGEYPLMNFMQYNPEEHFSGDFESYNEGMLDMGDDDLMSGGGECLCCTNDDGTECMGHKVYGGCECSYACPKCGDDIVLSGGGGQDPDDPDAYLSGGEAYYPYRPGPGGYKGPRSPIGTPGGGPVPIGGR